MIACFLELSLDAVHSHLVNLECLGEDIICDGWLRPEYSICHGYHPRVLAAQCCKCHCIFGSIVELEMDQPLREHKYISFVKNLCEQFVARVRCDKAYVEGALKHG